MKRTMKNAAMAGLYFIISTVMLSAQSYDRDYLPSSCGDNEYYYCVDFDKPAPHVCAEVNGKLVVPCKYYYVDCQGGHLFAYPTKDDDYYVDKPADVYTTDGRLLFRESDGIVDAKQEGGKTLFKDKYGNWSENPRAVASSSRSSSSSSTKPGLRYKGQYINDGNCSLGTQISHDIEIYDDYIIVVASKVDLLRVNSNGVRVYGPYEMGFGMTFYYYVDQNYDIVQTSEAPGYTSPVTCTERFYKQGSSVPEYQQQQQYQQQYQQPQYQQEGQQQNQNNRSTTTQTRHQCTHCGGKGWVVKEDSGVGFGLGDKRYCSKCGKDMYPHSHPPCGICNGKGWY